MNLSSFLVLNPGDIFHWFSSNPFRPGEARRLPLPPPSKPSNARPVLPAWLSQDRPTRSADSLSGRFRPNNSQPPLSALLPASTVALASCGPAANEAGQSRLLDRAERVEAVVLKFMLGLFVLASVGCGFGVQHIAYVRQKNALCAQLRQRELELHKVTQAFRDLESCLAKQAAQESQPVAALPVAAKHPARRATTRS